MSTVGKKRNGLLANRFQSHFWDTKIKSQNTTKAEVVLGYFIGPWGMLLTNSIVNSYFNQYLTDVVGFTIAKGAWIATFMVLFPVISKLIDAITNVLMSKILDTTVCRQGKVRPWMLLSIPFVFVSILMLFWIPDMDVKIQAVWVIIAYNLYYSVAYTMWNMAKELSVALSTRNVKQRRTNSLAANLVMNMGTGVVSIFFPLMLSGIVRNMAGGNTSRGYFYAMGIIACIAVPLTFVQYFFTRERITEERRSHQNIQNTSDNDKAAEASFKVQLKACLKDKYWIMFMAVELILCIILNLRAISLVYYTGWVVNGNAYGESVTVKNVGKRAGKALVQLYVGADLGALSIRCPIRELRGFEKIELQPGESREVVFTLDKRSFAHWDTNVHSWRVFGGTYNVSIGTSAHEMILSAPVEVEHEYISDGKVFDIMTPIGEVQLHPVGKAFFEEVKPMIDAVIERIGMGKDKQAAMPYSEMMPKSTGLIAEPLQTIKRMLRNIPEERWEELLKQLNQQG